MICHAAFDKLCCDVILLVRRIAKSNDVFTSVRLAAEMLFWLMDRAGDDEGCSTRPGCEK